MAAERQQSPDFEMEVSVNFLLTSVSKTILFLGRVQKMVRPTHLGNLKEKEKKKRGQTELSNMTE